MMPTVETRPPADVLATLAVAQGYPSISLCGGSEDWDDETGWLNVLAIVQSASEEQKRQALNFLTDYFQVGNSTH